MKREFLNISKSAVHLASLPPELVNLIEKSRLLWETYEDSGDKKQIQEMFHDLRVSFLIYFKNKSARCGTATSFEVESQRKIQMELLMRFHRSIEDFEKSGRFNADFFTHHKAWLMSELNKYSAQPNLTRAG